MPPCLARSFSQPPTGTWHKPVGVSMLALFALLSSSLLLPVYGQEQKPPSTLASQQSRYQFAIPRQPLFSALNAFSSVTGWETGLSSELAANVFSSGVNGYFSAEQALEQLLKGTDLTYRKIGTNNIVLERRIHSAVELNQVTISATRHQQNINAVPSTVSAQTREQLDRNNVNDIKELVRYEAGVSVGGTGQRSGISGYNIRGIDGDRVLTQIDGVEIPDGFFNGPYAETNRNYVDPEIVKRVEILRGPASVLYGSNAIGGAVSYFSLDPDDIIKDGKDVGLRLKTGYTSADNTWLKSATVAGRYAEVEGLLHLSQRTGRETESHSDRRGTGLSRTAANPDDVRTTNILAKLAWNYNDTDRLGLTYERYKDDRDTNQRSAYGGPYSNGQPTLPSTILPGGMYQWRRGNDTVTRERYGVEHKFLFDSLLTDSARWSFNYQTAKTDQSTEEFYYPITRQVLRSRNTLYKEWRWEFDLQLDKAFSIGDTEHLVTYGSTFKRQKIMGERDGQGVCLAVGRGCTAVGALSASDALERSSDFPNPTIHRMGIFIQDQIRWNDWIFTPGLRHDQIRLKPHLTDLFLNTIDDGDEVSDKSKIWNRVSPKLGVTYSFNDQYLWYGQYAEGFRTPTAKALYGRFENLSSGYRVAPNPDLEAEKSRSYETGLRGTFEQGSFDLTFFYNKYRDFINEDAVSTGYDEATFQSNNIKRAVIKGVEFKGRLELSALGAVQGLYSQMSAAYAYGRNRDTGKPLNSINPLKGVLGLGYDDPSQQYGGLLTWTVVKHKNRVDNSNFHTPDGSGSQFKTPGFGILDLNAYYRLDDSLSVNLGLYNLTDKKYWLWDDVRGYDGVGEAGVLSPANLDRLTQPGRNASINIVWDL